MSDEDFNRTFSGAPLARPTFTERMGRGEAATPSSESNSDTVSPGAYKPYGFLPSGNIGETCDVQRWLDGTEIADGTEFQYRFLLRISYVGEEELRLFLPDSIILITGRELRDLRKKLARRQVTYIQQYSGRIWHGGEPTTGTLVSSISILVPAV